MTDIDWHDRLLLTLNQHGFVWADERDWPIFDEWLVLGYCVDTDTWDKGHRMKRYEITVLGVHNASLLKKRVEK